MISQAKQVQPTTAMAKKRNGEKLSLPERIQLIEWEAAQYILNHQLECHAICEARDRKRNAVLGMPPTFSEVEYLVETPEEETGPPPKLTDFLNNEFSPDSDR